MGYKKCPNCGREAEAYHSTCPDCGADLGNLPEHAEAYSEYTASHLAPQDREIYEKAFKGDGEAMCAYGQMRYVAPMGAENAYEWFLCAARAGCGEGFYRAGSMWFYGDVMWEEQKDALKQAARLFQTGAKLGHAGCMFMLGKMYRTGHGVRRDDARAFQYLNAAAEAGDSDAMILAAQQYLCGAHGFPHNVGRAKALYERADALHFLYRDLRIAYLQGDVFPQDFAAAEEMGEKYLEELLRRYRTALQTGVTCGYAWQIGQEYLDRGDEVSAAAWFRRAMEQGDPMGKIELQRLKRL